MATAFAITSTTGVQQVAPQFKLKVYTMQLPSAWVEAGHAITNVAVDFNVVYGGAVISVDAAGDWLYTFGIQCDCTAAATTSNVLLIGQWATGDAGVGVTITANTDLSAVGALSVLCIGS